MLALPGFFLDDVLKEIRVGRHWNKERLGEGMKQENRESIKERKRFKGNKQDVRTIPKITIKFTNRKFLLRLVSYLFIYSLKMLLL